MSASLHLVPFSASAPDTPDGAVEVQAPAEELEAERRRGDELEERLRRVIRERAADKLAFKPNAIETAEKLIDWDTVDVDDQAAVERAFGSLRRAHAYLFAAVAGIDAGARNYDGRDGWPNVDLGGYGVDRIRRGYDENDRYGPYGYGRPR